MTSLSYNWRQLNHDYTIHAGHQSNAKEFRYLSTLRVKAAVKRSILQLAFRPIIITNFHRAGLNQHTNFLKLALVGVLGKQIQLMITCDCQRHC